MKTILATVLAGSFTLALAAAANAQSAQIPTPVNPFPINAVATDGTPLPSQSSSSFGGSVYSGRSAAVAAPFAFVGDAANSVVGTGFGVANGVR